MFAEDLKPAEFYSRGINKQEGIKNNGEYNIDWNLFINKSYMNNYILLHRKLFMTTQ